MITPRFRVGNGYYRREPVEKEGLKYEAFLF